MKASGLRPSRSPSNCSTRILGLICFTSCFWLTGNPGFADVSSPSSTRGVYVPATLAQVPDLRQRPLPEAQQRAKDARLRLEVSGATPAEPSRAVVVEQKPEPNTIVPVGSAVTVVVRVPPLRQAGPAREVLVPVEVIVPELRKTPISEAQQRVAERRLKLEVSGGSPQDPSRVMVIDQKPPPGTRVRVGTTVVVTVQLQPAPEWAIVPELRRQPLLDAQQRLRRARLKLEVAGGWPADPTRAVVADQKPGQETRVPVDSVVVVGIQILPPPPQVVSPPAASPPRVVSPPFVPPPVVPPPPVVSPPPRVAPPGLAAPPDVPPRDETVLVPDLRQRPLMDALQRIRNARLRLEVTGGWPADPGHAVVVEQTPPRDTRVRIGSSVTVQASPSGQALQPSPGPPQPPPPQPPPLQPPVAQPSPARPPRVQPPPPKMVVVPELRQQLVPEARGLTESAQLELRVTGQAPADETRTVVVDQTPAAGTRVAVKSVVFVEIGPVLLAVPELRKRPLREARQVLNEAGFELAVMGDPPSNEARAQVMEQAPMPGVRAVAGSAVTVRVRVSRLATWAMAGAGALLAAGAALGVARWRGTRGSRATAVPSVRVIAASDVGRQEIHSNGAAADGFAIRLRGRSDPGSQTVEPDARIVVEERTVDG